MIGALIGIDVTRHINYLIDLNFFLYIDIQSENMEKTLNYYLPTSKKDPVKYMYELPSDFHEEVRSGNLLEVSIRLYT